MEPMADTQAFISLKDHKEDFDNHPKCRLINPAKSNLGKVCKVILDKINKEIREETRANQWRNSDDTISWFKSIINNKNKHTFLSFDIADFYPSISEDLLDQAIAWGSNSPTSLITILELLDTRESHYFSTTTEHGRSETTRTHLT